MKSKIILLTLIIAVIMISGCTSSCEETPEQLDWCQEHGYDSCMDMRGRVCNDIYKIEKCVRIDMEKNEIKYRDVIKYECNYYFDGDEY